MTDRVPPYSEEAERGVLGAALLEPAKVVREALASGLNPEAFYLHAHRLIWAGIQDLVDTKGMVDTLILGEWLKSKGWLDEVGGFEALEKLVDSTPTAEHAAHYVELVAEKATLRRALATLRQAETDAATAESGMALVQTTVTRLLETVMERQNRETNEQRLEKICRKWERAAAGEEPATGLGLPWSAMTEITCGLEVGMTLLAARPSMGKTSAEDMIAVHVASQGKAVGRITLDSTTDELLARATCRKAGVSMPKMKQGFGRADQLAKCREAKTVLQDLPMFFDDHSRDIREIGAVARAWKLEHDIQLLTVDFVQLIAAADLGRSGNDSVTKVSYVSGKLKALSLELGIPVLALSQLSREIEKEGRLPRLSDLRDSGSLEQDAHKVIFIYADVARTKEMESSVPKSTERLRPTWLGLLKNKDGKIGRLPFWFRCNYYLFEAADPAFTLANANAPEWAMEGDDQ